MSGNPHPAARNSERRYDLDWLRAGAFGLLIFYHIGMFYVTWGWHVKSPYASHWLEPVMGLINPWRLGLLFLISGVALRFAMDKATMGRFLPQRLARLGIPIVFGVVVWVVPQAFYEMLGKGETGPDYFAFWAHYLSFSGDFSIVTPTYNHLWYVVYVLIYTLIVVALLPVLRRVEQVTDRWLETMPVWQLLVAPILVFGALWLVLGTRFPVTHALIDDWYNHAISFAMLLLGWFVAKSGGFWRSIERALPAAYRLALIGGAVLVAARLMGTRGSLFDLVEVAYAWAVIVTLLGLAQRWLNRPGKALSYLTEAVFPYYILHQTLIVCIGAWLIPSGLPLWAEAGW